MEMFGLAALILVAVMVGVTIPLLLQLRTTLKSVQQVLDEAGPRVNRTLDQTEQITRHVNAVVGTIDAEKDKISELMQALDGVTLALHKVKGVLRVATAIGAAVGPAVAAAVSAFKDKQTHQGGSDSDEEDDPEDEDGQPVPDQTFTVHQNGRHTGAHHE